MINTAYRNVGLKDTVIFADQVMYTGFRYATQAGISIGVDDMVVPAEKATILATAEKSVKAIEEQYASGLLTNGERYNKVVDVWSSTNELVAKAMMAKLGTDKVADAKGNEVEQQSLNSIYMMADSGARGSGRPDPTARRHAWPHGQAGWVHHRDPYNGQLPVKDWTCCSTSSPPMAHVRALPIPP